MIKGCFSIAKYCIFLLIGTIVIEASFTNAYAETEHYSFVSKLGKPISLEGLFENPLDSAVDSSGNVYVIGAASIQKFSSDGEFLTKWGDRDIVYGSRGIATDLFNNVYVVHGGGVTKFSNDGKVITQFRFTASNEPSFSSPSRITVDYHSDVYVSDGNVYISGNGVLKFTKDKDKVKSDLANYVQSQLSPLKQFKSGVSINEIICKDNLVRVQKQDGSPACVKEQSIQKLIERGWTLQKNKQTGVMAPLSETIREQNRVNSAELSIMPEMINGENYLVFEGVGWHILHNVEITITDDEGKKITSIRSKTNSNGVLYMPWSLPENLPRGLYEVHATDGIHQNDFVISIPVVNPVNMRSVSSELNVDVSGEKQVRRGTTHSIEIQVYRDQTPVDGAQVFISIEDYGENIIREFHGRTNQQGYFVFSWEIPKKFDDIETLLAFVDVTDGISSKTELFKFVVYCLPGEKGCKTEGN